MPDFCPTCHLRMLDPTKWGPHLCFTTLHDALTTRQTAKLAADIILPNLELYRAQPGQAVYVLSLAMAMLLGRNLDPRHLRSPEFVTQMQAIGQAAVIQARKEAGLRPDRIVPDIWDRWVRAQQKLRARKRRTD